MDEDYDNDNNSIDATHNLLLNYELTHERTFREITTTHPHLLSNSPSEASDDEYVDLSDDEYADYVYEPLEESSTKYSIVLCERYDETLHGPASENVYSHYLTYTRFKNLNMKIINEFKEEADNHYRVYYPTGDHAMRLEIAEVIYLPTDQCVSIIKTFWLKIIQKKWKKIFKERKECILKRKAYDAFKYREIYGTWPIHCLHYPGLKGLLC